MTGCDKMIRLRFIAITDAEKIGFICDKIVLRLPKLNIKMTFIQATILEKTRASHFPYMLNYIMGNDLVYNKMSTVYLYNKMSF